jgi:Helix-turn-helix domain
MSIKVMSRVWEGSRQSGGALLVLLAIADFADDDGLAFPSIGTLARKARLSERQVQRVLAELAAAGELVVRPGAGRQGAHLFRVTVGGATPTPRQNVTPRQDVTPDTMSPPARRRRRAGVTPATAQGVTPASPEPSSREPSGTGTPPPPTDNAAQQREGVAHGEQDAQLRREPSVASAAATTLELATALYRGLGSDLGVLTEPVRRRELAIAAQLLAVGATPAEAEAYARDMASLPGRLAPVDLRSFERERPSWLARRRGDSTAARRYVDRTGQGIGERLPDPPPAPGAAAATPAEYLPAESAPRDPGARETRAGPPPGAEQPAEAAVAERAWLRAVQARLEGADHAG